MRHVPQLAEPVFQHLCDDRHGGRLPEVIHNIPQYISISCLPSFPIEYPSGIPGGQDRPNQSLRSLSQVIDLLIRHNFVLLGLTRGRCASGRQLRGGSLWDWAWLRPSCRAIASFRLCVNWPMYVFPDSGSDRQALMYLLVAIHLRTSIMSKPIGLLISFDANMGLDLDNLNVLTLPQAVSHGLYGGF